MSKHMRQLGPIRVTTFSKTLGVNVASYGLIISWYPDPLAGWGWGYTDSSPYWKLLQLSTPLASITFARYGASR